MADTSRGFIYSLFDPIFSKFPYILSTLPFDIDEINVPITNRTNTYGDTPIENPYHRTTATLIADQSTIIQKCGPDVAGVLDPQAQKNPPIINIQSSSDGMMQAWTPTTVIIGLGLLYLIAKNM